MKFSRLLMLLACLTSLFGARAAIPQFSSDTEEHWYYIVFSHGGFTIDNRGTRIGILTATPSSTRTSQQWKFIGDADNFQMVQYNGSYAYFDGRLKLTENASDAASFRIVETANSVYPGDYEIEVIGLDGYNHLNMSGGALAGHAISAWVTGDTGNVLNFVAAEDIPQIPAVPSTKEYTVKGCTTYAPEQLLTLWYTQPATAMNVSDQWMEYALPIGNGEFGAMVYGGIALDNVQFNDKSLWTGSQLAHGSYQNFGNLYIEDLSGDFADGVANYYRNLDLTKAVATAAYTTADGSASYTREYLASNPDKVVAVRLASTKPGGISVRLRLHTGVLKGLLKADYNADGTASFAGKLDLVDFKAVVKAIPTGGTMTADNEGVEVNGADELLILLAGATNFDQHSATYLSSADAMRSEVDSRIAAAESKGWDSILADHVADHASLFNRVSFNIAGATNDIDTESLVTKYNSRRTDPASPMCMMLEQLYYAYGRYLLIGSSRGMDTPANLQGIWNHSDNPAWQSDIHSNINVQMNYWPAEPTNLSELHMPYLNYIHSMVTEHSQWKEYAARSGQTEGWTCFTQNNIFGYSDYAENYVIANAWYSTHMWQHYLYTLDREFLAEKAYPVMLSCAKFWVERLIEDADGTLVAPDEWSPEHGPSAEDGTAHAQQLVAELFQNTLAAMEVLGINDDNTATIAAKYEKLDKGLAIEEYTGAWGETLNGIKTGDSILREWKTSDYSAGENGHRHQSHLMALYPFNQITPESEYFTSAVNSLKLRGDESTGWSLGWRINLWARALDGEHAHTVLRTALRHSGTYTQSNGAGGIYYNLLDAHAPFQIDGNFGYTTGVTELLMHSYGGTIRLLPALPSIWPAGSIKGLKAVGNFEVDQTWAEGKLTEATVLSNAGVECRLHYVGIAEATVLDGAGNPVTIIADGADNISFSTEAGMRYTITFGNESGVENISTAELTLSLDGNTVVASDATVEMNACDLSGRIIATGTGRLTLPAGVTIVRAGAVTAKFAVR